MEEFTLLQKLCFMGGILFLVLMIYAAGYMEGKHAGQRERVKDRC